jgi:murein tripeptide amidase MpaA
MSSKLAIDVDFPGGSVEIVRLRARGPIELALAPDSAADVRQWFSFRVHSSSPAQRSIVIANAGDSSFPNGWTDYEVMASADGARWSRLPTVFEGGALHFEHAPRSPLMHYAYFVPYAMRRLERLLRRASQRDHVEVTELGQSVQGRPVFEVSVGDPDAERTLWLIARQHPGETPASWVAEGLLRRLMDEDDEVVRSLLSRAVLRIAPMVCPDGVELGNMRTSASGANLNRVWDGPDEDTPEVACLLERIQETGADLFLDVHADESAAFAFAVRSEGNPSFDERIDAAEAELTDLLETHCHEFKDERYYDEDAPGEADLSCASNQVGESLGIPAITLELPMKGSGHGRVRSGWNDRRARSFGGALVDALESWTRKE